MTQSRDVLAMMDPHTTTYGRKRGYTISRCGAFLLATVFVLGIVVTGLLVYHFAPCADFKPNGTDNIRDVLQSSHVFAKSITNKNELDFRLPRSVVPVLYRIKITPFIWDGNFTFNGEVEILVNVTQETSNITLHAIDMNIDEASTKIQPYQVVDNGLVVVEMPAISIDKQIKDTRREFHVIHTSRKLKAGQQYVVYIKYIGNLNDYLKGFYRSSYTVGNQTRLGLPSYEWDHYQRSVPMSTYLVAFVVSDFAVRRSPDDKVRVWARADAIDQCDYSLKLTRKILMYYEDYFQIDFPLPKIDMIALPDFEAGGMENWGLITYREIAILYQDGISMHRSKRQVAGAIAHELAHQWFGNLVTPSWWSDLWLNEGFATYVEYIGMDAVEPDWKVLEQFIIHELHNVFSLDALVSSHPISVQVGSPEEIIGIFDDISYAKGATIIRMMDHFLTEKVFKQGLSNYLKNKAYQSAEQNDLWAALTEQAHKDKVLGSGVTVQEIMDTWTLQTGFPVITITRDYAHRSATLIQERFMLQNASTLEEGEKSLLWWVPITYTSQKELNFEKTTPSDWMEAKRSLILTGLTAQPDEWMIFNVQQTGYYRVNYDERNWQMIIGYLAGDRFNAISTANRAQLIDDAFNLARAGRLDYSIALNVTSYLAHETEYLPWSAAFIAMGYLDNMLIKTQGYDKFRSFVLKLLDHVYKYNGFKESPYDIQPTIFTRMDVLNWACRLGHDECVRNAVTQFHNWRNTPDPGTNNPISPNLKSVIYCAAIRVGGQTEWDFVWQRYLETNVGSEKNLLLQALGCTRETWILSRYLDWAITENSGIRKQDAPRVFGSVASNVVGQPIAFNFVRNKWSKIRDYLGSSLQTINNLIKSTTKRISTEYELKDLLAFATEHATELGSASRIIQQSVEEAKANIRWRERNHATIQDWLTQVTV